ncbi:MAG: amidase [Alphaproteobacteria bacterium]|nr:amidase [Alphaproteobacteria bacterium]
MHLHELPATELRRLLDAGEITSVEIVDALLARRDAIDERVRGWVHRFDDQARSDARQADAERAAGSARGLLHGIPISIKENLATPGLPQTMGIRRLQDQLATKDAAVVACARAQGAIPLGKSNIPLLLLAMETHNDIWGTTHNPWDAARSPGGSSGGEGALIASGQSPLGLGTDIGGSIRIPAAWCGICGLKPTVGRWSVLGSAGGIPGQEGVKATTGPMARTVGDLVLLSRALSPEHQHAFDPRIPPLPAVQPDRVDVSALRVGVYEEDDVFPPAPCVRRAVREAADALRAAGATVVPYVPRDGRELVQTYFGALSADGAATAKARVGDQAPTIQIKTLFLLSRIPGPARPAVAALLRRRGEGRVADILDVFGAKPVQDLFALHAARTAQQRRELDRWAEDGLDIVLCPPTVTPPALRDQTGDWSLGAWHTMRYNLLDLPAGVQPVTTVREDEQTWPDPGDRLDRKAASFLEGSAGLPLAVQVVGRPWAEETVLAAMAAIEAHVSQAPGFPRTPIDPR